MDMAKRPRWRALFDEAVDTALVPSRALISRRAQKAYLGTALFAVSSIFLFVVASIAFWIFYWEYVPQPKVERVVHLQFGDGNPQGVSYFPNSLMPEQAYDIILNLHLPRTPSNLKTGNFMLSLSLFVLQGTSSAITSIIPSEISSFKNAIAHSHRPAILTYASPLTSTASTLLSLPFYLAGWSKESEILAVSMFDGIEFKRGKANLPQAASVIVEADEKMQFYEVRIRIIAKLGGLRWILYNYRLLSFLVFTTAFWAASVATMGIVWLFLSIYLRADGSSSVKGTVNREDDRIGTPIKSEQTPDSEFFDPKSLDDLSDTSRTFPTIGRQRPLRYSPSEDPALSSPIKHEYDDIIKEATIQPLQATAAEADDEDDFEDTTGASSSAWRDSGIGTSREEERRTSVQRRRKAIMGSGATG